MLMAVFGWGFGDFFIQKLVRKIGDWETLFIVCFFGTVILTPFIIGDFKLIFDSKTFLILLFASAILFVAALLDFEALKKGKLAVIEPLWSLEIIASSVLAFLILKESLDLSQILIMFSLIVGLILVSLRSYHIEKRVWLEKGVFLAILSAFVMGCANFFIGVGARASGGLMMNWFLNIFIAFCSLVYILYKGKTKHMIKDSKKNKWTLLGMCIFDNAAWIGFAFAMTLSSIGITVALSESYIIVSVLLGMIENREKLKYHQKAGLVLALVSAIYLGFIAN